MFSPATVYFTNNFCMNFYKRTFIKYIWTGVVHNFPKAVGVYDFCRLCTKRSPIPIRKEKGATPGMLVSHLNNRWYQCYGCALSCSMVVHYPRMVWKNSYAEHEVIGKTYNLKKKSNLKIKGFKLVTSVFCNCNKSMSAHLPNISNLM